MTYTDITFEESIEMEDYIPLSFEMNPEMFVFGSVAGVDNYWPFFH